MQASTLRGVVRKDHPMFSGGPEIFSRAESRPPSTCAPESTTGETQEGNSAAKPEQLSEDEDLAVGQRWLGQMKHNNEVISGRKPRR